MLDDPLIESTTRGRTVLLQIIVVVTLSAALFAEPLLRLVEFREPNGYLHVLFARRITETHVLYPGHFLYHVLTIGVHRVLPVSWLQAHFLVVLAARVLSALIVWRLVRQSLRDRNTADDALVSILVSLGLLSASAISFVTWERGNYYLGYIAANLTVSQTLVVLQPLALLTFVAVVRGLSEPAPGPSPRNLFLIAALSSVSTLAKPSYVMVLLPALGILLLARTPSLRLVPRSRADFFQILRRWPGELKPALTFGLAFVPVLAGVGWIYVSTYVAVQGADAGETAGVRIAPFMVMAFLQRVVGADSHVAVWLFAKFLLSIAFPAAVAVAYFPRTRQDLRFQLAWLQFAFGLLYMYLFAQAPSFGAGNFTDRADAGSRRVPLAGHGGDQVRGALLRCVGPPRGRRNRHVPASVGQLRPGPGKKAVAHTHEKPKGGRRRLEARRRVGQLTA
jgi:hypothetical protein